jgi:hypothetical protein
VKSSHQLAPVFIKTKDYGSDNEDNESVDEVMIVENPHSFTIKQQIPAQTTGNVFSTNVST